MAAELPLVIASKLCPSQPPHPHVELSHVEPQCEPCRKEPYEQSAIEDWFVNRNTSPTTGAHLDTTILLPNMMARSMVHEFVDRYPGLPECLAFRQKQSGS